MCTASRSIFSSARKEDSPSSCCCTLRHCERREMLERSSSARKLSIFVLRKAARSAFSLRSRESAYLARDRLGARESAYLARVRVGARARVRVARTWLG